MKSVSQTAQLIQKVSRRHVLLGMAGATAIAGGAGLWLVSERVKGWRFRNAAERGGAFAPSVYLAVEPAGNIVIWLVRSEMGQGVMTALPMLVAEELDADLRQVRIERAVLDGKHDYGSMATVASSSMSSLWVELRRAGATARHMLVAAAADLWDVPTGSLVTDSGSVVHAESGRRAGYGELAEAAASKWPPLRPRLKQPHEFRLIGKSQRRLDVLAKVTGEAKFGLDVRLPGMLIAVIARSPTFGGRVSSLDDSAARAVAGVVEVLQVPTGVAVIATGTFEALRGLRALQIGWWAQDRPVSSSQISSALHAALANGTPMVARDDGVPADAMGGAGGTSSAVYEVPYLAHAPMEPMNCVASVTPEGCEVWAPTQTPNDAQLVAARITGLPLDRITVNTTFLGGGFGRRAATDFVAEAVDLAARLRKPVQVVWTREDDMRNGLYRPTVVQRLEAAIENGYPAAWRHTVVSVRTGTEPVIDSLALMGADVLPYAVGPMRVEWSGVQAPIPTTIWRSVGHSFTAFAIESFLDELAQSAGMDPVRYRLSLLPADSRLRRCIQEVATLSAWEQGSAEGRILGVAAASCFGSHIALVVELGPDGSSGDKYRVAKAWCVADCGVVVNPDGALAQMEGGILFGLTAALKGRITVNEGRIVEGNFDTYPLLRINETPEMVIQFIPSAEPPGGAGELGVPPVAPAVANALFAAHGRRLRSLPLSLEL